MLHDPRYRNPENDPNGAYLLADLTAPFYRPTLQYEWNGYRPPAGRSWRYSQVRAIELEVEGRIIFSQSGRPRLKRYLSEARQPRSLEVQLPIASTPELIVRAAMRSIAVSLAQNPDYLGSLEWRDLERVLREVFERMGFATELTRPSKDGGFDLRLQYSEAGATQIFLVEVKHWVRSGSKPGRKILKAFIDVVVRAEDGTIGLLLSSSGFTEDVMNGRTEIQQCKVRLGDKTKIVSLCQNYLQSVSGLWAPTTELAAMLLDGTH